MGFPFAGVAPLIQVFDMPASVAFYRDLLGFEIAMQSRPGPRFGWALLRGGGAELMLNTLYEEDGRPGALDPMRREVHGDLTLYFHCGNLDEAYEYLRSRGVAVETPVVRDYGMRQLMVRDPDGYGLCFQHPVES
jgi:catechol 2,3-dioxygenase-like lactoylglutathione lyase family enzyme